MTQFEKTFHFMKKPWVIALYVVLVVLVYHFIDMPLATYFYQHDVRTNFHVLNKLTLLGKWFIYAFVLAGVALFFRFIKHNTVYEARAWYLFFCVCVANLVCLVLKVSLSRARPDLLFSQAEFGFYWWKLNKFYWSFPSGHTTTVVSLAAGLGIVFPRYFYAALALAFVVVATRVLLYHHYLSDVMTAFYISILVVGFLTQYLKKNHWFFKKGFIAS